MWKRFGGSHGLQVKQCNLHDVLAEKTPKGNLTKMVVVHKRNVKLNNKPTKRGGFVYLPLCLRGSKFFFMTLGTATVTSRFPPGVDPMDFRSAKESSSKRCWWGVNASSHDFMKSLVKNGFFRITISHPI